MAMVLFLVTSGVDCLIRVQEEEWIVGYKESRGGVKWGGGRTGRQGVMGNCTQDVK